MTGNDIITGTSRICMREDGIIHAITLTNTKSQQLLKDSVENVDIVKKLAKGKPYVILIELAANMPVSKEAIDYYTSEEVAKYCRGLAFIVNSTFSKLIANFFLGLNKPPFPVKMFTNEADAIQWLRQFLPL
jgi:hypothetical protein